MMPQFLQTLMGYTAESAGLVLSGAGLVILFEMPIVGQLTTKIPAKYIMAFGWLCLAVGMYYSTMRMDLLISFASAAWLRVAQAFGLGFLFVPITLAAYIGIRARKRQQRIGPGQLHAQYRQQRGNVHGHHAAGAARAVSPIRSGLSRHQLRSGVSQSDQRAKPAAGPRRAPAAPDAQAQAYGRVYQSVLVQSQTLAYIDTYHDARGRRRHHVRAGVYRQEERSGRRRAR